MRKHPEGYVLVAVRAEDERETGMTVASGTVVHRAVMPLKVRCIFRSVELPEGVDQYRRRKPLKAARLYGGSYLPEGLTTDLRRMHFGVASVWKDWNLPSYAERCWENMR